MRQAEGTSAEAGHCRDVLFQLHASLFIETHLRYNGEASEVIATDDGQVATVGWGCAVARSLLRHYRGALTRQESTIGTGDVCIAAVGRARDSGGAP